MGYPDHLLEQAKHLARREKTKPRQASLRRAVSTAYYSLFHLLIHEATLNWKRVEQRALLARFFEHGKMKAASERQRGEINTYLRTNPSPCPEFECARHLHRVADTFSIAQHQRQRADYDNTVAWMRTEVLAQIVNVETVFQSWHEIREEPTAQAYLVSLLGSHRGA
jgi:uncharacterized protein (UPF0332 family)